MREKISERGVQAGQDKTLEVYRQRYGTQLQDRHMFRIKHHQKAKYTYIENSTSTQPLPNKQRLILHTSFQLFTLSGKAAYFDSVVRQGRLLGEASRPACELVESFVRPRAARNR